MEKNKCNHLFPHSVLFLVMLLTTAATLDDDKKVKKQHFDFRMVHIHTVKKKMGMVLGQ